MAEKYSCWKCGADISDLPFPLGRMSKCSVCKADLHVCKLCKFYDKTRANQCQEPVADPVTDKQRANFCGYFEIDDSAFQKQDSAGVASAQDDLSALFGESLEVPDSNDVEKAKSELDKLFGGADSSSDKE